MMRFSLPARRPPYDLVALGDFPDILALWALSGFLLFRSRRRFSRGVDDTLRLCDRDPSHPRGHVQCGGGGSLGD